MERTNSNRVWWAWHNKDKSCMAARLKTSVQAVCASPRKKEKHLPRSVRQQQGISSILPRNGTTQRESLSSWEGEKHCHLSSFVEKQACVLSICAPANYPQWRSSWHCVTSVGGSRGERRLHQFVAASGCHHRACDVLSLLQAGREGARCEKGQRERRRQPAAWGGLGNTCGQLQAVPTLGCTPSSSAAGWCPLRRRTQIGCSPCLLHT